MLKEEGLSGVALYLVRDGYLEQALAQELCKNAMTQGVSFNSYLIKNRILPSETILHCLAKNFGLPIFDLTQFDSYCLTQAIINPQLIQRYRVLPLSLDKSYLQLGVTDPSNHTAIEAIRFHTGLILSLSLIAEDQYQQVIRQYFPMKLLHTQVEQTLIKAIPLEETSRDYDISESDSEPIIQFVNQLLNEAIEKSISDIHIEPYENYCRIRFRQDGLLYEVTELPHHIAIRIITRLKILAKLDITERRLPQDGRFHIQEKNSVDIRINTCPTLFGEKIVLRLLNIQQMNLDIKNLGMNPEQKELFLNKLSEPQGLILVTGPTGSGKTITLYSVLHFLNQIEKNISTIEDPVEIKLTGINQVAINTKIGLDFTSMLRTLIRQDPDIIMIGEIRDAETAHIAIQAAQTGHLVLSTLHTNSAIETLTRLQSMNIPLHNLMNALTLIVAQRLIRKLCIHCRKLSPDSTSAAAGCQHCHHGYLGRTGVFEVLPLSEKIKQQLFIKSTRSTLLEEAKKEGFLTLWDTGLEKVRQGITSYAELNRVITR